MMTCIEMKPTETWNAHSLQFSSVVFIMFRKCLLFNFESPDQMVRCLLSATKPIRHHVMNIENNMEPHFYLSEMEWWKKITTKQNKHIEKRNIESFFVFFICVVDIIGCFDFVAMHSLFKCKWTALELLVETIWIPLKMNDGVILW